MFTRKAISLILNCICDIYLSAVSNHNLVKFPESFLIITLTSQMSFPGKASPRTRALTIRGGTRNSQTAEEADTVT
jgi:hypothetical protein